MNVRITAVAVVLLVALGVVGQNHLVAQRTGQAISIRAVSDGEKIERDEINSPLKRANSLWNGRAVKLFGARNEIIAFQLIIEGGDRGVEALSVSLRELIHKNRGAKITYAPNANGYEGPGEGVGDTIIPATFYRPGRDFDDRESAWRKSDEWMSFLKEHPPHVMLQSVVPRVFSDATVEVGFAESGDAFEAARYKLAKAIAAAKKR